jgi:hypothetical protein
MRTLRWFVKRVEPGLSGLSEAVKWGNGCWVSSDRLVAYVYSATGYGGTGYVQFGFFNGSFLEGSEKVT